MGKIKSAWEIALERTQNIQIDKDRIRHNQAIDTIRRAAGAYLSSDTPDGNKLKEAIKNYPLADIKEALALTVMNGLTLPAEEIEDDRFDRLKTVLGCAVTEGSPAYELFDQIIGFLKQYPVHRNQLMDQMKAQFEPMIREKEAQMREKYGEDIHLSLESDKEFAQVARQNLDKLEMQYTQTLDGAKTQLKEAILS